MTPTPPPYETRAYAALLALAVSLSVALAVLAAALGRLWGVL